MQKYLAHVEMLFSPELFIIGGVSRKADKFLPLIEGIQADVVPAQLRNNAGIVGGAMAAALTGPPAGSASHPHPAATALPAAEPGSAAGL